MIASGHCWQDICGYSYRQLLLFTKVIARLKREELFIQAKSAAVIQHGSSDEIKRLLKQLG